VKLSRWRGNAPDRHRPDSIALASPRGYRLSERAVATRGSTTMNLSAPTKLTFRLSLIVAILALLVQFVPQVGIYVPIPGFWIALASFVLLALGNILRGF